MLKVEVENFAWFPQMIRILQIVIYFKILCQRIVLLTCVDPLFLLIHHFMNALIGKSTIYHVSICLLS